MRHGRIPIRTLLVWLWLTCSFPVPVFGQPPDDQSVYTLRRAIDAALSLNPGIRAAGFEIDVATARRDLNALRAPMSVQVEVENFLGSGAAGSFDSAETTLQISRVLELGGKRDLRERLGNARVDLAATNRTLARIDLAAEVARRFIRLVEVQEELLNAEQAVVLAQRTLEIVRRRVEVGSNSAAELATAEIALGKAQVDLAALGVVLDSARLSLATLWGAEEVGALRGQANLLDLPPLQTFESLASRVSSSPDLLRSIDESHILEAERRLAESRHRSDLGLTFGVRRLGETDDTALVFGATLPLGRRARSSADIAASSAAIDQLNAQTQQRRLQVISVLAGLHAEMRNAWEYYRVLRETLVPRSEDAAALYREGFEVGSFSLLEFNRAQQDLLSLRRESLAAAARYHTLLVDIEQLLGGTYGSGVIR